MGKWELQILLQNLSKTCTVLLSYFLPFSPCSHKKFVTILHSLMESSNINDIKIKSRIATVKISFNTVTIQTSPHTFLTSAKPTAWIKLNTKPRMVSVYYKSKMIHQKAFCFELITIKMHLTAADVSCSHVFCLYCVCIYVFERSLLSFELWLTDSTITWRHH